MSASKPVFQNGYKYALLSLPRLNAAAAGPLAIPTEGYALTTDLPVDGIDEWQKRFGWYHFQNLAKASRYIVVYARAKHPELLDYENQVLNRRLHRFHLGILLACPFISHEEAVFL